MNTDLLLTGHVPTELNKSKIIAILKPNKPKNRPESCRSIALLSSCYKLMEEMLINRLDPLNLCRPVAHLTTHIEAGFQKELQTTVVFVDLTAAYNTV
ncbi:hypothetical protein HUJ04_008352 [Dendroctonus ponderosae]|nr:hypothetical protein HUJ04_008352 [Dendroctonus ponderosae]